MNDTITAQRAEAGQAAGMLQGYEAETPHTVAPSFTQLLPAPCVCKQRENEVL